MFNYSLLLLLNAPCFFPVWALPLTKNQMYICAGSNDVDDILECLLNGNNHNETSSENEVKRFINNCS